MKKNGILVKEVDFILIDFCEVDEVFILSIIIEIILVIYIDGV